MSFQIVSRIVQIAAGTLTVLLLAQTQAPAAELDELTALVEGVEKLRLKDVGKRKIERVSLFETDPNYVAKISGWDGAFMLAGEAEAWGGFIERDFIRGESGSFEPVGESGRKFRLFDIMGQDFLISEVNELIRGGPDVELNGQIDDVDAEIVSSRARIEDLESDIERAELELDQIKKTQPLWWITHLFKVLGLESDIDDWDEEISGERSAIRSLQEIRADLFELAHPFETEIVGGELEAKLNKKETKVKVRGKLRLRATNPDTGETVEGVYRIESKGPREPR